MVELRGPGVGAFLGRRFSGTARVGKLSHGLLTDLAGEIVDDPVVALLSNEHAELSLHGGPAVMSAVMVLLAHDGFEAAAEPTTLDDRIEAAIPLCRTELALRVLLAQRGNRDLPLTESPALRHLLHPLRVAVVGLPNVGKSTLVNALSRSAASITADLPGTTRDYVLAEAEVGGLLVTLLDTPGQRATEDAIEAAAIELARREIASADLHVVVLDASRGVTREEEALLEAHPDAIVVANRADLATGLLPTGVIATVATTGEGLDLLAREICGRFGITEELDRHRLPLP